MILRPGIWPRRLLTIRTEMMILNGLLLAAIAVFIYVYFPSRFERQAMLGLQARTAALARMASFSVAPALFFDDEEMAEQSLLGMRTDADVRFAAVQDARGGAVLAIGASGIRLRQAERIPAPGISADGNTYYAIAPVKHEGALIGQVAVGMSLDRLRAEVQAARRVVACVSLIVFLVGLAAIAAIGLLVTGPLRAIAATAARVAGGELDQRVRTGGPGEVGQLADVLNRMLCNLQTAQRALEHMNRTLEDRVCERTAELTRATEDLAASRDEAQAASRAKSEFLANMSHEIRTPLNGVVGMIELAQDTAAVPQIRDYLRTARGSADALMTVINDILDFSKIEAGMMTIEPHDFDPRDLVESVAHGMMARAARKGLELIARIDPGVPAMLVGDAGRLRQILVNLMGNALKFTEQGEVEVSLVLEDARDGTVRLRFRVRDTGIGIPEEKSRVIFDAFAQADGSTTRRYGGTGLGLAISSQFAALMGGRIEVESEVGRGSTFHFGLVLPVSKAKNPVEDRPELAGLRALVVDDHPTNRQFLVETLLRWRMEPVDAGDGLAALSLLREPGSGRFDLILVDGHMPGLDGWGLAERIRAMPEHSRIPILMLTSVTDPRQMSRSRAIGINAVLTKPVMRVDLLRAITAALSGSREPEEPAATPAAAVRLVHVLLAEDHPVNQKLASTILTRRGHRVRVTSNGLEAVNVFRTERFDLILMDIQMPCMSGFEATAAIREIEAADGGHTPIIAMTAHAMKGDREECLAAGMDDYIAKPVRPKELLAMVEDPRWRRSADERLGGAGSATGGIDRRADRDRDADNEGDGDERNGDLEVRRAA